MKRSCVYLALCGLLAFVSCGWSNPVYLGKEEAFNHAAMCLELKTSLTYVVYGVTKHEAETQSYLCYRTINVNDTVSEERCLKQERIIENVTVACGPTPKHVSVAYAARRVGEEKNCTWNGHGCYDVYFTETTTGGRNWTKAVPIPRKNMSDLVHRTDPKLLFINETGRLFVAYTKLYPEASKYGVATATRPRNSSIFSNEVEVDAVWSQPIANMTLAYILLKGKVQLNIIFAPIGYCFQRRYSMNNGKSWEANCLTSSDPVLYAMAMSHHKDRIYVVYGGSRSYTMRVMWLTQENEWEGRLLGNEEPLLYPIVADVTTSVPLILLSGYINTKTWSTFTYDVDKDEATDLEQEPPKSAYRESLTLYLGNTRKVRVLFVRYDELWITSHT